MGKCSHQTIIDEFCLYRNQYLKPANRLSNISRYISVGTLFAMNPIGSRMGILDKVSIIEIKFWKYKVRGLGID
jgi:lipoate synthase